MKTQRYGCFGLWGMHVPQPWTRWWWVSGAHTDYKNERLNGDEKQDGPQSNMPEDGKITWVKGKVKGDDVYGVKNKDGYYDYECRYDEGPGDKKWMEECDRNYLARLHLDGAKTDQERQDLAENSDRAARAAEEVAKLPEKQLSNWLKSSEALRKLKSSPVASQKDTEEKRSKDLEAKQKAEQEQQARIAEQKAQAAQNQQQELQQKIAEEKRRKEQKKQQIQEEKAHLERETKEQTEISPPAADVNAAQQPKLPESQPVLEGKEAKVVLRTSEDEKSVEKSEIDWLKKAKAECPNYGFYYPEALAAIQTAYRILGKDEKEIDVKTQYQVIVHLENHCNCTLSEVYRSFCDSKELEIIENSYAKFSEEQKSVFPLITYFRNTPQIEIETLCKLLPETKLTCLNLGSTHMGDAGAQSIAEVLPHLTQLTSLDLRNNDIEEAGANFLIEAVAIIRLQGRTIDIHGDTITEEKIIATMERLRKAQETEEKAKQEFELKAKSEAEAKKKQAEIEAKAKEEQTKRETQEQAERETKEQTEKEQKERQIQEEKARLEREVNEKIEQDANEKTKHEAKNEQDRRAHEEQAPLEEKESKEAKPVTPPEFAELKQTITALMEEKNTWHLEQQKFAQQMKELLQQQMMLQAQALARSEDKEAKVQEQEIISKILEQLAAKQEHELRSDELQIQILEIRATEEKIQAQIKAERQKLQAQGLNELEIKRRLEVLEQQLAPLQEEYQERQEKLNAQQYISQSQHLKVFYQRIQAKLNQIFLAYMAIASDKIKTKESMIEVLGVALNTATLGLSGKITAIIMGVSNRRDFKRITQLSNNFIISITATEAVVEKVARTLSLRYEEQIKELTLPAQESFFKRYTFTSGANGGVETLAECAVARIINGLNTVDVSNVQDWEDAMVAYVFQSKLKSGFFKFTNKDIAATNKNGWTDEGIFQRSGLKAYDSKNSTISYYKGKEECSQIIKYGFRWGTEEEVKALGLTQCSQPSAGSQASLSAATNKYIQTLTSGQQGIANQQQLSAINLIRAKDAADEAIAKLERLEKEREAEKAEMEENIAKLRKQYEQLAIQEEARKRETEAQRQQTEKLSQQLAQSNMQIAQLTQMMQQMLMMSTLNGNSHSTPIQTLGAPIVGAVLAASFSGQTLGSSAAATSASHAASSCATIVSTANNPHIHFAQTSARPLPPAPPQLSTDNNANTQVAEPKN